MLSGSRAFIEELNQLMINNGFPHRKIDYVGTISDQRAFFICYRAAAVVKRFYNFVYNEVSSTIYYSRKKEIFLKYYNI